MCDTCQKHNPELYPRPSWKPFSIESGQYLAPYMEANKLWPMALNCDSCGSTYTLNPATCNHCQAKMCSMDCYLRHVKSHPTQDSISTLVTDAELPFTSSTVSSSVRAADLLETAPTPSPTLNGTVDNRTTTYERPFVVYLSGPMHGSKRDADDREMAAEVAKVYSAWLWNHDYAVFSPQLNTTHMYYYGATGGNNSAPYMAFDLAFITEMADAILMLPGWEHADGCVLELEMAELKGIHIWKTLQDILDWEETR